MSVMGMTAELKVDIVFSVFFCSLGLMVQDDVAGGFMDGIHIHITKSNDGCGCYNGKDYTDDWFSFLNTINNTSKQNNVCTAHMA